MEMDGNKMEEFKLKNTTIKGMRGILPYTFFIKNSKSVKTLNTLHTWKISEGEKN